MILYGGGKMSAALHRATLKEEKNVDADTGFLLRHVKSDTERFSLHAHEFYEIFLTLIGKDLREYVFLPRRGL